MAVVRLIKHHVSKGKSIAQSIKGRLDYGKDKSKTMGGELIRSYMCDYETADAEFLLSKAQYKAATGREQKSDADVLCYQIRQSFKRGETDAQSALDVGYDLAMRWTKGRHAFIVASHIDSTNPHVHIYYNSTSLDCTRKFRDFHGSAWVLRKLSDRICIENDLSVIADPLPHSKGMYKHYGQWLGDDKPQTYQERLKAAVDTALSSKPQSLAAFIDIMAELGYEHKTGRGGVLSFRAAGQANFTRLRSSTLGEGYGQDDILAIIKGRSGLPAGSRAQPRGVNLVIDIQEKLKGGKGPAYVQWAKVYNLKQMAAALQYLQENDLLSYGKLEGKANSAVDLFQSIAGRIKETESALKRNSGLRAAITDYARTRPVFEEYKSKKYSNRYLSSHSSEIHDYRAAQAAMKELLKGEKLPKMDALKHEAGRLSAEKKALYSQYRTAQKDMREAIAVKQNIDHLLGISDIERYKEMSR